MREERIERGTEAEKNGSRNGSREKRKQRETEAERNEEGDRRNLGTDKSIDRQMI